MALVRQGHSARVRLRTNLLRSRHVDALTVADLHRSPRSCAGIDRKRPCGSSMPCSGGTPRTASTIEPVTQGTSDDDPDRSFPAVVRRTAAHARRVSGGGKAVWRHHRPTRGRIDGRAARAASRGERSRSMSSPNGPWTTRVACSSASDRSGSRGITIDDDPHRPGSNQVRAVIEGTGDHAEQALAVGDVLWVTGQSDDTTWIDPKTNAVSATMPRVPGHLHYIAAAFQSVWITTADNKLDRIDPTTGRIVASIRYAAGDADCQGFVNATPARSGSKSATRRS